MNSNTEKSTPNAQNLLDGNKSYFDTIALLFFVGLLITDFIPDFDIVSYTVPIHYLYLSFLNVLMGIYIYFNPTLLNNSLIGKVKKSLFLKLYFLFLILCAISLFFARNIPLSIVSISYLLIAFLTIIHLSILFNNRLYLIYKMTIIVVVVTFLETAIVLLDFLKLFKTDPFVAYKLSLNTGNINIFAATLNLKIPFVLLGIFTFSSWKKWLSVVAFASSCLILFLNNNKAAFLSLAIVVLIFLIYKASNKKVYKTIGILLATLVAVIGLAYFITKDSNEISTPVPTEVSMKNAPSMLSSFDKEQSASSRFMFWKNALELSKQNLLTGVGLGNYAIEISPYDNKSLNDGNLTLHPHNDFIEILVETGIINGLIYIALFITLLVVNLKRVKSKNQETQIIALITISMLVVYGIDSLLNFPLHQPTVQIGFCLIMIFTLLNQFSNDDKSISLLSKNYILPTILVSLTLLYFTNVIFKSYKLELEIKTDFTIENHQITADYIAQNLPKYPNVNNETYPFLQKLGIYYYFENKFDESKKTFAESKKINPFSGVEDWYLSKIYEKTNVDSAQYYIKKSFDARPRDLNTYLNVLFLSNMKKDTVEMLKTNEVFSTYRNAPINYIHTSNALYNSGYNIKKLNNFIDEGLRNFPGDSSLIERKKMFQKVLDAKNGIITSNKSGIETIKNDETTVADDKIKNVVTINTYLQEAVNYGAKGQYDLAIKSYLLVLEKYPDNLAIHQNIGICKFEQKKFKEAIPYLEKSLNDPKLNDGKSEYLLGISYLNTQNKEKGCSFLNKSKAKNYPNAAQIITQYCK